ncbi:DNA gyrase subunit B [Myxococcus sp. 1LA]
METPSTAIFSVRKRPGMYCGDMGVNGLHQLVQFFIDAVYEEARRGERGDLVLEAGEDGSVTLFSTSSIGPATQLARMATQGFSHLEVTFDNLHMWRVTLPIILALSSRYQLDQWADGQQWRLLGEQGQPLGAPLEVTPREPMPVPAERGLRIHLIPDPTLFEARAFDLARLASSCNALAALVPGLRVCFADLRSGERTRWHLPGGLAQWADHLTEGRSRLHAKPLFFETECRDFRIQGALQWCDEEAGELLSFANAERLPMETFFMRGVARALRGAMAELAGASSTKPFPWERVARELTGLISMNGDNDRMRFSSPAHHYLNDPVLAQDIHKELQTALVKTLREHQLTPGRLKLRPVRPR